MYFTPSSLPNKQIHPEEVMKILKQEGMELSLQQAQLVLDFLYKFAKISLAILVENPKSEWYRQFNSYKGIMEEMGFFN